MGLVKIDGEMVHTSQIGERLTDDEQEQFNQLHVKFIVQDKRFRNWSGLSHEDRIEIIDSAEKLAEAEFLKTK